MGDDRHDLLTELKTLRKGRGINLVNLDREAGPGLRALSGVLPGDPPGLVRQKLTDRLNALADLLPPDLAKAAKAALALHPQARHPFLAQRTEWLAGVLERDTRTARRRMEDALAQLAEQAGALVEAPPDGPPSGHDEYYIERFGALLRLDRPTPEALERRVVVASRDGLTELDSLLTLPRDPTARENPHELDFEVLYGVMIAGRERDTDSRFRFRLRLPHPLAAGERHEYGLLFRVPPRQVMRTHYVFTSHRRCDAFELRIRFDADRLPVDVRRISGCYPRDVDEGLTGEPVELDGCGELRQQFTGLSIGRGYGAAWNNGPAYRLDYRPPVPDG
ncbi:MAG TPA: hypothetical protein VMU51_10080 [Mycobacteriales bacterium]|nr:hypothetical protein [Mycobacteriales bacterium]